MAARVAIVTGAAQGIGAAVARRLVADRYAVVVTDRRDEITGIAAETGSIAHVGDVGDVDHVRHVVDTTVADLGPIAVLVNNAGEIWPTAATDSVDGIGGEFDRMFASNIRGAFLFGRHVVPSMIERGGGDIVNISTDHVLPGPGCDRHHGHGSMDLYNASKWALNGLTFDWARSLARHHIRVNNVCMGATDTEMLRNWMGPDVDPAMVATWMQPDDVAAVISELIAEGPNGRTADSVGLYAGQPCVLPPPL